MPKIKSHSGAAKRFKKPLLVVSRVNSLTCVIFWPRRVLSVSVTFVARN